ncbi:Ataxin-3 [Lamellibrachia satsuma]|nr:Ataxin-3 [Lamellibrachia satsuma]
MDAILHEKQEGSLCAQHCLNALLQGNYFTAVDLADIARQLDESERQQMAEAGTYSEEYRRFLEQPSNNFDDSGYFSVQVLATALRVWDLEFLPFNSSDVVATAARTNPRTQKAYICNFRDHWFSVRKLGNQWFNLNSLLTGPELISDTYLTLFLTQLQQEGYSIFVVVGDLPHCEADDLLKVLPAVQTVKPRLLSDVAEKVMTSVGIGSSSGTLVDDEDVQRALDESQLLAAEEEQLQAAIALSMQDRNNCNNCEDSAELPEVASSSAALSLTPSAEEVRKRRLAFLQRVENDPTEAGAAGAVEVTGSSANGITGTKDLSEEEMLAKAISMSMQT